MTTTRISTETIYLTDNGRAVCGEHLGATARMTSHDLSGQPIEPITPELARICQAEYGYIPACEDCGKKASLLIHA